jgi:hypothetical protein
MYIDVFKKIKVEKKKEEILNDSNKIRYYYSINGSHRRFSNILIFIIRKFFFSLSKSIKIISFNTNNNLLSEYNNIKHIREPIQCFLNNLKNIFFKLNKENNKEKIFFKSKLILDKKCKNSDIIGNNIITEKEISVHNKKDFLCYFSGDDTTNIIINFTMMMNCGYYNFKEIEEIYNNYFKDKNIEENNEIKSKNFFFDVNFNCIENFQYEIKKNVSFIDNNFVDKINFSFITNSCFNDKDLVKDIFKCLIFLSNNLLENFSSNEKKNKEIKTKDKSEEIKQKELDLNKNTKK